MIYTTEKYPHFKIYEQLYARYFKRTPEELLIDYAQFQPGDHVLDLCGGNGRASLAAKTLGAERVLYVDRDPDMIPEKLLEDNEIECRRANVEDILRYLDRENFNIIICQQAVNYWLMNVKTKDIASTLTNNGVFIFNTFNQKPSTIPMIKEYELNNKKYLEVSYCVDEMVHHIQAAEGLPPHTTKFLWISSEDYHRKLETHFHVTEFVDSKTSIYVCRKK